MIRPALMSLIIMLSALSMQCAAQTMRGDKSFGPKAGYVSRNSSAVGGLVFEYSFSRHVRIAPQAAIIFRHNDLDGFTADVDVHFPFAFAAERAAFYPLAGVGFTSWGHHSVAADDETKDVTTHTNVFGFNCGAGIEYYCKRSLKLSLEARYSLMRHYPTACVTAGIAFVF